MRRERNQDKPPFSDPSASKDPQISLDSESITTGLPPLSSASEVWRSIAKTLGIFFASISALKMQSDNLQYFCGVLSRHEVDDRIIKLIINSLSDGKRPVKKEDLSDNAGDLEKLWEPILNSRGRDSIVRFISELLFPKLESARGDCRTQKFLVLNTLKKVCDKPELVEIFDDLNLIRNKLSADQVMMFVSLVALCDEHKNDDVRRLVQSLDQVPNNNLKLSLDIIGSWVNDIDGLHSRASSIKQQEINRLLQVFDRQLMMNHERLEDLLLLRKDPEIWLYQHSDNRTPKIVNIQDLLVASPKDTGYRFFQKYPGIKKIFYELAIDIINSTTDSPISRESGIRSLTDYMSRFTNEYRNILAAATGRPTLPLMVRSSSIPESLEGEFEDLGRWFQLQRTLLSCGLSAGWVRFGNEPKDLVDEILKNRDTLRKIENILFAKALFLADESDPYSHLNIMMHDVVRFLGVQPPDGSLAQIYARVSSDPRANNLESFCEALTLVMSQVLAKEILKDNSRYNKEVLREAFRDLTWSDGPPTRIYQSDGTPNPLARRLQREASEIMVRGIKLAESFSAFTIDARHAPDGEPPIMSRFMVDASRSKETGSVSAWTLNSERHDTFPGRGMGCLIKLDAILPEVWSEDDRFGGYKKAWKHLSPQAITEIDGCEVWMIRGHYILIQQGQDYTFNGVPMVAVIRNDHYFNHQVEGYYLIARELVEPALRLNSFSLEDGFRFNPDTNRIGAQDLNIEILRNESVRKDLPFLDLTHPTNLFGTLAKAPEPSSSAYHSRERQLFDNQEVKNALVTDIKGHIHHAFWGTGEFDFNNMLLEINDRSLVPARMAAKESYQVAKAYLDLFDVFVALRAYWGQFGRVVDSEDLDIGMEGARQLAPLNSGQVVNPSYYMLREAWRYFGEENAPIFIAVDQRHFGHSLKSPWYIDPKNWKVFCDGEALDIPYPGTWPDPGVREFWETSLASKISQVHLIIGVERHRISREILNLLEQES